MLNYFKQIHTKYEETNFYQKVPCYFLKRFNLNLIHIRTMYIEIKKSKINKNFICFDKSWFKHNLKI